MADATLPERVSLEYLRKLAKDRLREMRQTNPGVKLAAAQLAVARAHGFPSWRALKAEVDRRSAGDSARFFDACSDGDLTTVRELLERSPALAKATDERRAHPGWTALHTAGFAGQAAVVRLLLERGADPHARESGDNTVPLHWAAARQDPETVRALLDAGADVHGTGDVHELDVIGWATVYREEGDISPGVIDLLIERGARHHIYSAIAIGDPSHIRAVVASDPRALQRRMSRFEHGRSPLHFAIERKRADLVDLLIELGARIDAPDSSGNTPIMFALTRGESAIARRLLEAGAVPSPVVPYEDVRRRLSELAAATSKGVPMIGVPDIAAALDWYASIGFREVERYAEDGLVNFGLVAFGKAEVMLGICEQPNAANVRLWFYTPRVEELYTLLKSRQLQAALSELNARTAPGEGVHFVEDLYDPFYGGRQFSIEDPHGYTLIFYGSS